MLLTKTYPKNQKPGPWRADATNIIDKVKIRRSVCRESYYDFCQEFWSCVVPETPVWNWHIRIMARELQRICELVFRMQPKEYDLIFNVPPGSSKSTIGSILLLPWCWTRLKSLRLLGGSFDADLSLDLGNKARRVVKHDLYRETFPEIEISSDQDTKGFFSNVFGGERRATSTGASIIGRHAHIHIVDDPINPKGIRSEVELRVANEWMTETLPSRCVSQAVTPQVLIMQRLGLDDPTGIRLERKFGVPVRHICLPAELSDQVKPPILKNKYKEGLLDPIRLPKVILETKRAELGNYGYSGQFEQLPIPLSGGMFQYDKIQITQPPPKSSFSTVVRWWDKAATKDGGAYTAGVFMGLLRDAKAVPRFWILDVVRGQWDSSTRERIMRQTTAADDAVWGKHYTVGIEQEPGSAGVDSAKATITNLAGFKVIAEKATGDKFERADPFSVQVNAGNVGMAPAIWNRLYLEEMKHFGPNCKYKDQMDSSSGGFKFLAKRKMIAGSGGF